VNSGGVVPGAGERVSGSNARTHGIVILNKRILLH
jgi:hypothetical protein